MTDSVIAGQLKALADDYERRAEKASHADAAKALARSAARVDRDEPDRQISPIRLPDKTSRRHPRHVATKCAQAYEPEVPIKVREWIGPALASKVR